MAGVQHDVHGDRGRGAEEGGGEHRPPRHGRHQDPQPRRQQARDPRRHRQELQTGTVIAVLNQDCNYNNNKDIALSERKLAKKSPIK